MSLLLTKTCHYAILVAIEEGEQFKARSDKDVYVTSRLDIKLPPQVDDLIPLNTRLSTTPTVLSEKPQWRTTLIYYISHQILSRLKNSQATLDIISISEDCKQEKLGSVTLSMQDAKSVLMRKGGRDMSQIQQFVVDKGDWIPIRGTATGKIKAGLFIVEMPYSTESNVSGNKEFGTPLQIPVRSNHSNKSNMGELGLEICSDMSDLFINLNGDDDPEQQEESILDYQESDDGIEQEEEDFITIGSGTDKIGFLFRIIQAKHISSILNQYSDIEEAYFYYHFGKREYQCLVEQGHDNWRAIEYHSNVLLQGSLQDIKDWLSEQNSMEIFLVVKQLNQSEDIIIGKSEVFLKSRDIGISQQSVIIYDTDKSWHINQEKQFAQMQLQIGLTRGWETIEDIGNISKQVYRYTSQDFTFDNENEVF